MSTAREFKYWSAPKSYRYKEEAIYNHAPQAPGIYWIASFPENGEGKYLYMGLSDPKSVFDTLFEHWKGETQPDAQKLLATQPNVYFGFIVDSDAKDSEDLKDLYYALIQQEKPEMNDLASIKPTGRYTQVSAKDHSIFG